MQSRFRKIDKTKKPYNWKQEFSVSLKLNFTMLIVLFIDLK